MKTKLPIFAGIIYTLISLLFVFGLLIPSLYGDDSPSYLMISMLIRYILGGWADKLEHIILHEPRLYSASIIFIFPLLLLVAVSFLIGLYIDKKNIKEK